MRLAGPDSGRLNAGLAFSAFQIIKFVSGVFSFSPFGRVILPRQGEVAPEATEGEGITPLRSPRRPSLAAAR